jgi:hypothetical protein
MTESLQQLNYEDYDENISLEEELAVTGLAAQIEAHNSGIQPFGLEYSVPVDPPHDAKDRPPTPKWCNKRIGGVYELVIDGKD